VGLVVVEFAAPVELDYLTGVLPGPEGDLGVEHLAGEDRVDHGLRHIALVPGVEGQLEELKLADLQEVRRIGHLGPLQVVVVVGPDQGLEKAHMALFARLSARASVQGDA
jgi:hypothetical protein